LKRPASGDRTYLATFAYDGTDYVGWQFQPDHLSVQQALEEAFTQVTQLDVRLRAAGRTDSGVHALAMPADFTLPYELDLEELLAAWDAVSPRDISVLSVDTAPTGFSARRRARRRTYRYLILNRYRPSPFLSRWCWHLDDKLDINAMRTAMSVLPGEHDFTTFRASDCEAEHPRRRIYDARIVEHGGRQVLGDWQVAGGAEEGLVVITITGSAFLKHQVRSIVGTLVEVGRGKMSPSRFGEVLAAADRELAGPTAPARGLTFVGVEFGEEKTAER